jgi:glycine/D-amino acid oxidase-like deaminating enzyme
MPESEILILGGGIAGASTALYLAHAGHDVALLERGDIGSEASGVNAGSIDSLGWGDVPDLQTSLTAGSLEIFRALQLDEGFDIEFRQSGSLRAIHTEAQHEWARRRVQGLRARGLRTEILSTREARGLEPELNPRLAGALWAPLRAQADPRKATRAFAEAAAQAGARVLTQHEVSGVREESDGYRVETSQGAFAAGVLVIAAGAWCAPVGASLGLSIPVVPVRGQMWATRPLPPRVFHVIGSVESALFWEENPDHDAESPPELTHRGAHRLTRHLYGRQTREGDIIFGGDRQLVGYTTTPDPAGIEVNRSQAAEVLPLLAEIPVSRTWAGLMPFSLDGKPLIGRIPGRGNLYIVSGLASSGFGRGPMAGKLLADYIHTGDRPPVLEAADPARCVREVTVAAGRFAPRS